MTRPLELWFEFASTYSYVGAARIEDACRRANVPLAWRPFLLGPIFTAQLGIKDSPFNAQPVRGRYMWRDVERLCEKYALRWKKPTAFPRNSLLAARVACAGAAEPWLPAYVRHVYEANFADDLDISSREVVAHALSAAGAEPTAVLARAGSDEIKATLRANTDRAVELGIFGAPTCVVDTELFFGQDRIDDAVEWASRRSA